MDIPKAFIEIHATCKNTDAAQEEIGLLYATSDGENIVARALGMQPGDNVVIDDLHYRSTYVLYQRLKEELGIEVRKLFGTSSGKRALR